MDQEFNSNSKVLKNSPTMRRSSKILNKANLIKFGDKETDKKRRSTRKLTLVDGQLHSDILTLQKLVSNENL